MSAIDKYALLKASAKEKLRRGHRLTLDETAVMIWNPKKEKKPMTAMGVLKIERRALAKIRSGLAKYGITKFADVFGETKSREAGSYRNGNDVD